MRAYSTSRGNQIGRGRTRTLPSVPSLAVPDSMKNILKGNKAWAKKVSEEDPSIFTRMAAGQSPKYLYFGCSDSRIPANNILGLGAGEVFVHRNVGALVPGNDLNALSVLEYAVAHLGVTDIIVAGHYDCGAIRAASSRQDLGMLENWLRLIRDTYRLHKDELNAIKDSEERHRRLVELNVTEQCMNLFKTAVVQKRRATPEESQLAPRIHGTVFDQSTGLLKYLDIDFDKMVSDVDQIYSLGYK